MLLRQFQVRIRICALMSTDRMLLQKDENGSIALDGDESWKKELARSETPASFAGFLEHMTRQRRHWPHALVFDCSYSAQVGLHHPTWIDAGLHVVSTNVKALSGPIHLYNDLKRRRQRSNACYMSEVTVGGGLPIMSQLRSLINAGDEEVSAAAKAALTSKRSDLLAAAEAVPGAKVLAELL